MKKRNRSIYTNTQKLYKQINKTQNNRTHKCKYFIYLKLSKHNGKRRRSGSLLIVTFLDACLVQQWWGVARGGGRERQGLVTPLLSLISGQGSVRLRNSPMLKESMTKEMTMDNAGTKTLNAVKMH